MASNTDILSKTVSILKQHGVNVVERPGWKTRQASKKALVPEAVVVHHTGDKSTPLSVIEQGRATLPGPLANWLVGQSGTIYLCAAGYTNNAGYSGQDGQKNFALAKAGKLTAESRAKDADGKTWSANSHAWAIEGDGAGQWNSTVYDLTVKLTTALHIAHGWTKPRVIAHKELTRRKIDPGNDMGKFRADVAAQIKAWAAPKPSVKVAGVNVATYNCEDPRFGGKTSDDGAALKRASASVFLLVEAPEKVRNPIRKDLGGADKVLVWTGGDQYAQAICFRKSKWQHGSASKVKRVTFGPTSYHGGVIATLTDKVTGREIQFGALHLPPTGSGKTPIATETQRKTYLEKFVKALAPDLPTIIGGDFNSTAAGGWLKDLGFSVLSTGATTDSGRRIDYLAARDGIDWIAPGEIFNPGPASDHKIIKGKARTSAPTN